jgi:hypothetical protein
VRQTRHARLTRRQVLQGAGAAAGAALIGAAGGSAIAGLGHRSRRIRGASALRAGSVRRFVTRPDLRPPAVDVAGPQAPGNVPPETEGLLFLGPGRKDGAQGGPLIVDRSGELVWFKPLSPRLWGANFGVSQLEGQPVLAWWEGTIEVPLGYGRGEAVVLDSSYRERYRIRAANGQVMDVHELQLTPEGTALFTCHPRAVAADLSGLGGPRRGRVLESMIQERDIRSGRLLLEWRSLDHVPVTDSYRSMEEPYDYLHVNSIEIAPDGHLLISGRHTWALYKLHRRTGEVIWRLGGKRSDFQLDQQARFTWQHDARQLDARTISLFENGSDGRTRSRPQSRGLVLDVDASTRRVRVRGDYRHPRALHSAAMGSVRILPTGRVLVGWGDQPYATEFDGDGDLASDTVLPRGQRSYRSLRLPWNGSPRERPAIAARRTRRTDVTTVYVSWSGATEVSSWQISAQPRGGRLTPLAIVPKRGFETPIAVATANGQVVATALDGSGRPLASSEPLRL